VQEVEGRHMLHKNMLGGDAEREDVEVDHKNYVSSVSGGEVHQRNALRMLADEPHGEVVLELA